jgi:hypothetical protein
MPVRNKSNIASFFTTGSIPSESNYGDLIDSTYLIQGNGVLIETRGNDRVIRIDTAIIDSLIDGKIGDNSSVNNSVITVRQPFATDDSFSLNQDTNKTINVVFPNGSIEVTDGERVVVDIKKSDATRDKIDLSKLAFSGDWVDVQNKPTIPDAIPQVNSDWKEDNPTSFSFIRNKPNFAGGELFLIQNGREISSFTINNIGEIEPGRFTPESTLKTYYEIEAIDWDLDETDPGGIKNKPLLHRVAYTGNYNDLFYKPGGANNPPIIIYRNKERGFDSILKPGDEGSGATATATTKVSVVRVDMMDGGTGYSSATPPNVVFQSPPDEGGIIATGIARVSHAGIVTGVTNINSNLNRGYQFFTPPTVTIDPPPGGGKRATGFAILEACLDTITVTNGGSEYTTSNPPKITVVGGNGAVVTPIIDNGRITNITITERGINFTDGATIIIGPAPIVFTLNQPDKGEYDLDLALVALTGDFEDLANRPIIGEGDLILTLNNNELVDEEDRFNANIDKPAFVNINAATHITLEGDVNTVDHNMSVDEHGHFHVNNALRNINISRTTTTKSHDYNSTDPNIVLSMVDALGTDTKGRVTSANIITHTFPNYLKEIYEHGNRITTLEAIGGRWIGFNFQTFADLDAYVKAPDIRINEGDFTYVIRDESKLDPWGSPQLTLYRWVEGSGFVFSHVVQEDPIGAFINGAFGLIKGEATKPEFVNAQPDGTGRVNLLPKVLDHNNETKNVWLDKPLPDGYCVFGFRHGRVAVLDLKYVSEDNFSIKYEEDATSVLRVEDPRFDKFYVYPCEYASDIPPELEESVIGTDFWLTFGRNRQYVANRVGLSLQIRIISFNKAVTGTIHLMLTGEKIVFNVDALGVFTHEFTPLQSVQIYNSVTGIQKYGIHVVTDNHVSVYALNSYEWTTDATNVLPTHILGIDHYIISYQSVTNDRDAYAVVATENNTTIYVEEGLTQINLDAGDVYYRAAATENFERCLTGRYVKSDKPVAVFSVSQNVQIPNGISAQDCFFQQLPPVNVWGMEFFAPVSHLGKDVIRIVASENNTNVVQSGATWFHGIGSLSGYDVTLDNFGNEVYNMMSGQFIELRIEETIGRRSTGCYIKSNKPIGVCVYLASSNHNLTSPSVGDPSMAWLPSIDQYVAQSLVAPFIASGTSVLSNHYALITTFTGTKNETRVSKNNSVPTILHGGNWVDNVDSGVSFYIYDMGNEDGNLYNFTNNNGLLVMVYGSGSAESYYYLGFSAMRSHTGNTSAVIPPLNPLVIPPSLPITPPSTGDTWSINLYPNYLVGVSEGTYIFLQVSDGNNFLINENLTEQRTYSWEFRLSEYNFINRFLITFRLGSEDVIHRLEGKGYLNQDVNNRMFDGCGSGGIGDVNLRMVAGDSYNIYVDIGGNC